MAESVLNLACVGRPPGRRRQLPQLRQPEHPEVMWQLSEAIDGMAEACRAFAKLPVIGGNVSLYNETAGADIDPTPGHRPARAWSTASTDARPACASWPATACCSSGPTPGARSPARCGPPPPGRPASGCSTRSIWPRSPIRDRGPFLGRQRLAHAMLPSRTAMS